MFVVDEAEVTEARVDDDGTASYIVSPECDWCSALSSFVDHTFGLKEHNESMSL